VSTAIQAGLARTAAVELLVGLRGTAVCVRGSFHKYGNPGELGRNSRLVVLVLLLGIAACAGQASQPDPKLVLINRVRARMAENLASLPNYTCLETIDRSVRRQVRKKLLFHDRIHLEVAFIEANEMFSWPGSSNFGSDVLQQIPKAGASGVGGFGGWIRTLFSPSGPKLSPAGECMAEGRHGFRYDFAVPVQASNYAIDFGGRETMLPYKGSLCVDPDSSEVILLEIQAAQPQPPVKGISEAIHYGRAHIGSSDFLLPQDHELVVTDVEGNENRSLTHFTACREYTSSSSLTFAPESIAAPVPREKMEEFEIPGGLFLDLKLETPVTFEEFAVGDGIAARLDRGINASGVAIPKGAIVFGRVRALEQYFEPAKYFVVGLEFSSLTFNGKRGLFRARLVGPRRQSRRRLDKSGMAMESDDPALASARSEPAGLDIDDSGPGGGAFRIRGGNLNLGRGLEMILETRDK